MTNVVRSVVVIAGLLAMGLGAAEALADPPQIGFCASNCPQIGQCAPSANPCYVICKSVLHTIDCNTFYYTNNCTDCPS